MWCKAALIAFLGTTTPGYVVKITAAKLAYYRAHYGDAAIEAAKQCAADNHIRYRILRPRRWRK